MIFANVRYVIRVERVDKICNPRSQDPQVPQVSDRNV